ncbi:F-box/WD repeat-containing protein 12 [Psammomys obesus]|uniref:F-box/WD repeat-containing protein 12 n=1 Tax=Psammomys obesus TaxID=48139 RepID=UPI002452B36F|nr:F-box/WD repeat-containing protein 12 [Psammomys obesus]
MEFSLPSLPMLKICSYLDAYSLLQVGQVNKSWNAVSNSDFLWRRLCLMRWYCFDITLEHVGTQTWKQFFLYRSRQERAKSLAKPADFFVREIPGNFGGQGLASYLSGSGLTPSGQGKSVVCVVTSMSRLTTWDIKEGVMTWVSPVQPTCITRMTTLPEMHLAVTVDMETTIKLWNCRDRDAQATNTMFTSCQTLKAVLTKYGPVVLASDTSGNLYVFRIPDLCLIIRIHIFQYPIDEVYCSPQKKWVFLNKRHPKILPKVFLLRSLLRPLEYSNPVFIDLPFSLCQRAFWTPRREDRITLMSRRGPVQNAIFSTFDMELIETEKRTSANAREIAGFEMQGYLNNMEWMGVSEKDVIVFSTGKSLLLFNMWGFRLQTFQDYPQVITRLKVDPLHVIVTFNDGTLEVYAWEERNNLLRKCYRLQHPRHLGPQSIFPKTLCDDLSIVRVVSRSRQCCFLAAYILNVFS